MRHVIFVNGKLEHEELLRLELKPSDHIVCADGGASHAGAMGIIPHIVIGDFDSIPSLLLRDLENRGVKTCHRPRKKDESDLELALAYSLEEGAKEILLVCALGGRLDYTLGNILLLCNEGLREIDIQIFDGATRARVLWPKIPLRLTGKHGITFSLLPLNGHVEGLTIIGAEWSLQNERLEFGTCRGISNTFISEYVDLKITSGTLLVITNPEN